MLGKWTEIIIMALLIRITFDSLRQSRLIIFVIYGKKQKIASFFYANRPTLHNVILLPTDESLGRRALSKAAAERNGSFRSCIACLIIFKWSVYFILWGVAGFCSRLSRALTASVLFDQMQHAAFLHSQVCSFCPCGTLAATRPLGSPPDRVLRRFFANIPRTDLYLCFAERQRKRETKVHLATP